MTTRFVCPRCGATSYNIGDIANRYCAQCQVFVDDPLPPADLHAFGRALRALLPKHGFVKIEGWDDGGVYLRDADGNQYTLPYEYTDLKESL